MNLTTTALQVLGENYSENSLSRAVINTAAAKLERYEAALKSIALSHHATEEGRWLARVAADALKENN